MLQSGDQWELPSEIVIGLTLSIVLVSSWPQPRDGAVLGELGLQVDIITVHIHKGYRAAWALVEGEGERGHGGLGKRKEKLLLWGGRKGCESDQGIDFVVGEKKLCKCAFDVFMGTTGDKRSLILIERLKQNLSCFPCLQPTCVSLRLVLP